jgi:hypothetical protein
MRSHAFFDKIRFRDNDMAGVSLIDGSYSANNPTLFAVINAWRNLERRTDELAVINVGTGNFPFKKDLRLLVSCLPLISAAGILEDMLEVQNNTMLRLTELIVNGMQLLRINGSFYNKNYRTNVFESNTRTLEILFDLGRISFAHAENKFSDLFFYYTSKRRLKWALI